MPNESTAATTGPVDPSASAGAGGLSAVERSRLLQCFQRGTQNAPTNLDYAIELAQWIHPEAGSWIAHNSNIPSATASRP